MFTGDTRTVETPYSFAMTDLGPVMVPTAKLISFGFALALAALLWLFMARTDTGRAIRAVAREPDGARLVGIRPARMFALAYGIGIACLGAAACLLLPTFYVSPGVGNVFVLLAFTIVVLGGMGSFVGAVVGGLLIGVTESRWAASISARASARSACRWCSSPSCCCAPPGCSGRSA